MKQTDIYIKGKSKRKSSECFSLSDFIEIEQLKQILESVHIAIGLGIELYDLNSNIHLEIGTQPVCKRFHHRFSESCYRCYYKKSKYLEFIELDGLIEYSCMHGLQEILLPVKVNNRIIALLFYGQFLYSDNTINESFFYNNAKKYDFNAESYLYELKNIPIISKQEIHNISNLITNLFDFITSNISKRLSDTKLELLEQIKYQKREIEDVFEALDVSEEKYRSIISVMNEGVIIQSSSGEIIAVNKAAEQILGSMKDQIIEGNFIDPHWHAIHEDGSPFPGDTHPTTITLETGKSLRNIVMGVYNKEGELIWIQVNTEPIYNKNKLKPIAVVTSYSDITKQKNLEIETKRENEFKNRMFRVIAHDLASPIGSISEMVDMIISAIEKNRNDDSRKFLRALKKSSKKTYLLINELLEWANILINHSDIKKESIQINKVIDDVLLFHSHTIKYKCLKIEQAIEPLLKIYAYKNIVQIIIRNILSNSIKYTPAYGTLFIDVHKEEHEVKITIKDNGIGMTHEELKSLSEPSTIISKPGTNNERGFGLGLYICRELIKLCHSEIKIESKKNEGTSVSIILR